MTTPSMILDADVNLEHIEAPLALCSTAGRIRSLTPEALELFRRLDVLQRVPAPLPRPLWDVLDQAPLGQAVEWRPPARSREVLGCTRKSAEAAVRKADSAGEGGSVEQLVKAALKIIWPA